MRMRTIGICLFAALAAEAQIPQGLDLTALKGYLGGQGIANGDASLPNQADLPRLAADNTELQLQVAQDSRLADQIKAMKDKETGPRRFASDLFDVRQRGSFSTDGGIAEDYVLGTGDQVYLNAVGSASFDLPLQVDGRGEVQIPKVGSARVAGLTLGRAREVLQGVVSKNFARTTVDLQVVRLREVRVSVMGEVYQPGAYLVPSLASLVNVLSLTGGPTRSGSFRDIRVMRGGRLVFRLDLYPLRAEGTGNPNFTLQSGDVIFVPLNQNQILLEGAFTRVVANQATDTLNPDAPLDPQNLLRDGITREIHAIKSQLEPPPAVVPPGSLPPGVVLQSATVDKATRRALEMRLAALNRKLAELDQVRRADHRLKVDPVTQEVLQPQYDSTIPGWLRGWQDQGIAPQMSFEIKPGETVLDLYRFAGGLVTEAGMGTLIIRRRDLSGRTDALTVMAQPEAMGKVPLWRGDVLSALPQRDTLDRMVQVAGWARIPGVFSRAEGLRVGDLLKRDNQVLPTTYRARGEIVRTLPDNRTQYFAFDVDKAIAGDPAHNLLLADRDRIELYQVDDFRLMRTVTVLGPVSFPGPFNFHDGMRASDLIFRAGVPNKSADRLVAELAHTRDGKPSEVVPLDLAKLLSTDSTSPLNLNDDRVNPKLLPDDQLSIFERPDYRTHRTVQISGQVARPGSYTLEEDHETLSHLIQRAGGLTADAMPKAGILLRPIGEAKELEEAEAGLRAAGKDPTANGINDILNRLSETKRQPNSGTLISTPVLHALQAGDLSRLVVDFNKAVTGKAGADVELVDGDQIIVPRRTDAAYVVGETASPFAVYKVNDGMSVGDLIKLAGGPTRNADTWNIRLLKADGRIIDRRVTHQDVEPGDAVLVPQKIKRDFTWQENLASLTPLALILNAIK